MAGHATGGLPGLQAGGAGTHCATHVCPVQLPDELQVQPALVAPQAHGEVEPLLAQPQEKQVSSQCSPLGQSASDVQPDCWG